jgi:hypothetical protein
MDSIGTVPNSNSAQPPIFRAHRAPSARPWPLTVLCLALALLIVWSGAHALSGGTAQAFGVGYWPYFCATGSALGVALLGIWRLRRWALWAFPLALLLDTTVVAWMGELRPGVLVFQLALVLLVLSHARAFGQPPGSAPG